MQRFTTLRAGSPGYRIGRLYRANTALMSRQLKKLPVSWGQVPLLMEILNQEGRTQEELSRQVRIDPACTARALAALEKEGLVTRKENPACRRDKQVFATPKAEDLLERLLPAMREHTDLLLKGFSPEETRQALDYFDRMLANMEQALEDGGPCADQHCAAAPCAGKGDGR